MGEASSLGIFSQKPNTDLVVTVCYTSVSPRSVKKSLTLFPSQNKKSNKRNPLQSKLFQMPMTLHSNSLTCTRERSPTFYGFQELPLNYACP